MKKRFISAVLALLMLISTVPISIATAADTLCWPVPDHKSLSQGYHDGNAIDISDKDIGGAIVVAAKGGTVKSVFNCSVQHFGSYNNNGCNCSGFGTGLVILGTDGRAYQYAHMQAGSIPSDIVVGATVSSGQTIGRVGTTGNSSGNHLHFAISYTQNYLEEGPNPDPNDGYISYYDGNGSDSYVTTFNSNAVAVDTYYCLASGKTSAVVRNSPHDAGTVIGTMVSGDIIHVSKKGTNGKTGSSYWYYIDTGKFAGNYIYSANVQVTEGTVKFSDLAASSITSTGAKVTCTMQVYGLSTSSVTEVGVKIWNSSFSKSACDKTINWTTSSSTTVFYNTVNDCGISLNPGTTCNYQFYAIVSGGRRIESETKSFVTSGGHTHSYGTAWKSDGTNHWHECSCGAKSGTAAHTYGSWTTTTAATHTTNGSRYRTCTVCGYKQTETIPATGHSYGVSWKSDGTNHWHECSCGAKSGTAAHTYGSWTTTTAATHTTNGSRYRTCTVCGYKQTETIPAIGHSYGVSWKSDGSNHWHECSCGAKSSTAAHSYGSWTTTTAATHTTNGSRYRTCTVCGYKQTETIGKLSTHTYNKQITSTDYFASAATCTEAARYYYSCECGEKGSTTFSYGEPLGHNYVNGECTRCHAMDPSVIRTGTCGENLTWKLNLNTGKLTISGAGAMTDFSSSSAAPWRDDRASIKTVEIEHNVASIGNRAFNGCRSLTSITIPDSVTSIGSHAFEYCYRLASVIIPNSVTYIGERAFEDCSSLTNITIPNSVTSICDYAFRDCSSLTSVTIPDSVTYIGDEAFYGCSSLTSVTIGSGVTYIGISAFSYCSSLTSVTIGSGVTYIGYYAFSDCSSLTNITIPNSVTSIRDYAFRDCSSLTGFIVAADNTAYSSDENGVLFNKDKTELICCPGSLTSVTIPNSVTSIGDYAFRDCSSLTSVTIPDSVTTIGDEAFYGCSGLTSVTIPDSVTSIGSYAFYNCSSLTSITIPNSVTGIGRSVFSGCSGLTSVTIPDSVTSISDSAFEWCSKLSSITIPNSVTGIGEYAFQNCPCLTSITIPSSVTSIGEYAFCDCNNLTNIYYTGTQAQWDAVTMGRNAIPNGAKVSLNSTEPTTEIASGTCGEHVTWTLDSNGTLTISGTGPMADYYMKPFVIEELPEYTKYSDSIKRAVISEGVTSIGDYAFVKCRNLTSLDISNSVASIGNKALSNCGLTTVNIPSSVINIELGFGPQLTYISVDEGNPKYSSENGVLFNKDKTELILCPDYTRTSYTIPNGVIRIGDAAFASTWLTTVDIPNSVTSIGDYAFNDCSLETVSIPNGVTSIGIGAFYGCRYLTSVTLSTNTMSIGDRAFYDCVNLTSVTIPNSVTSIGNEVFGQCWSLTDIYYLGSQTEWESIAMGQSVIPSGVAIHYSYHIHSYDTTWHKDAANHWHECSCGDKNDVAAHTYGAWTTTAEATHTTDGSKHRTCTACGYKQTETIPASGHSYDNIWHKDAANHWHECSCGDKSDTAAHTYGAWTTTAEATHTTDGSKYRTCTVCGYKQTQTIPATGHSYDVAWKSDSTNHWHECSCGAKSGTAAHSYGDWIITAEATETSNGSRYHTCTACGYKQTETIPVTGHSFDTIWHSDDTNHWHECSCGDKSDVAAHNLKNGVCSVCGYIDATVSVAVIVEENVSNGITAEIAAALSSNEAVNSFTDTGLDSALAGTPYEGKTATVKASVESVTKTGDTTTLTFDIAPYVDGEDVSGAVNGSEVTARVPLTAEFTNYAKVEHDGDDDAYYEVKTGSDGAPYIDIVTTHFSSFTVSNVDKLPDDGGDDPDDPTPPDDPKPSGGCYVATCVYGSYDCPEVWTLRRFRDETLAQTWYGRLFIKTYYAISPTIVKWFGDMNWFKNMWRGTLDKMVANLNAEGVPDTPYDDIDW